MKKIDRKGNTYTTNSGHKFEVIEYINSRDCSIVFNDGVMIKNISFGRIQKGNISHPNYYCSNRVCDHRIGEIHFNTYNETFKIVEYNNQKNIKIKFKDGTIKIVTYQSIKSGKIKNPNSPQKYGLGYIGCGIYSTKNKKHYNVWNNMFQRCYSKKQEKNSPTYKDVNVCEEWYNFQVFAEWFENNYKEGFQLDKDILIKGNKIYSPETCCFVPQEINTLFVKNDSNRGKYPIGVTTSYGKPVAQISGKNLGTFNTVDEAFKIYKIAKEKQIKEVADKWKTLIDPRVYQALYNYKVEIAD